MRNLLFALLLLPLMASCVKDTAQVTLDSLLDEMISVEESARYPLVPYRCLQVSSYDRSSVSPDSPGWLPTMMAMALSVRIRLMGEWNV